MKHSSEDFNDKRVLITGASKGLGFFCAEKFASMGSQLVVTGRDTKKLEDLRKLLRNPDRHMVFAGDLAKPEVIKDLISQGMDFLQGFDIIVHVCGGGYGFREPLLSWNQLDMLHKVNVGAAAEINRLAIPYMIKNGRGNVIHICSISSQEATASVGYNTVKASLAAYVRSLGRELASTGLVITGILPGAFYAPGNSWERLGKNSPEVVNDFIEKNLPRKKIADAEEVVSLILFLASYDASMMSGSCVPIDAGEGKAYVI